MGLLVFDPFRTEARLAWGNRWARWRRDGGQTLFHAGALAALAALLVVPLVQSRAHWGASLATVLQQWPVAVWLVAVVFMAGRQAATFAAVRTHASRDWLATLPVPRALHRRRRRDAMLREALAHLALGGLLLLAARVGAVEYGAFAAALGVSLLFAPPLSRIATHRRRRKAQAGSVIADHGTGRLWRWQRIACGVALRGRTLSLGALALLTPPMDSGIAVAAVVAVAGLMLALLSGAWRRSLAVLPQAQAWLAAQPLSSSRLLRGTWAVPAGVLACVIVAVGGVLAALGAWQLSAFAALSLLALGALHFAATAAERHHPRRAALAFLLHAMLLLAALQSFAPAALPLWVAQIVWLLRRALR